jgi:hypothetical protein
MKKYFEFILPRSHNQLIHNNKRFSFIDKLLLYKFVHFMTYIVQLDPVASLRMKHPHYSANTIHTDTSRTVLESPSDKEHGSKV